MEVGALPGMTDFQPRWDRFRERDPRHQADHLLRCVRSGTLLQPVPDVCAPHASYAASPSWSWAPGHRGRGCVSWRRHGGTSFLRGFQSKACRPYRAKTKGKVEERPGLRSRSLHPTAATRWATRCGVNGSRNRRLMCYKRPWVEDGKSAVRPPLVGGHGDGL
jgi:hypothetical protein